MQSLSGREATGGAPARLLAEIDALSARNRCVRDPEIEQRLVALRHEAFAEVEAVAAPMSAGTWPPEVPDLFSGEVGVPEISSSELSASAAASGVFHHGCLLVRGLLSSDQTELLVEDIDHAYRARAEAGATAPAMPWYVPMKPGPGYRISAFTREWVRRGGGLWAADSPRALFDVIEVFEAVGLRPVIEGFLGERPVASVDKWTLRCMGPATETQWHQDGSFLGQDIRTLNVWVALSRCGVDAPGLDLLPRRVDHVLETGTEGAVFDNTIGHSVVERYAGTDAIVRPRFEPGDALLFDHLFVHRTAVSPDMTESRYAIESWFFAPSSYPSTQIPVVF